MSQNQKWKKRHCSEWHNNNVSRKEIKILVTHRKENRKNKTKNCIFAKTKLTNLKLHKKKNNSNKIRNERRNITINDSNKKNWDYQNTA